MQQDSRDLPTQTLTEHEDAEATMEDKGVCCPMPEPVELGWGQRTSMLERTVLTDRWPAADPE